MKLRNWIFFGLLFLSACGTATETPSVANPGDYQQTIFIGGIERHFLLHVPSGYDGSKALPLVFVFHGYGGSAAGMVKSTQMNSKADQENFIVAYLNGTPDINGNLAWLNGITQTTGNTADDVGFVRELAKQLEAQLNVDEKRVYAAGLSNGGMMCHRLGAELSDILAGVAVVAGAIGVSADAGATFDMIPEAQGPIPVNMLHGQQDPNIPYYGGQGAGQGELYVKSVEEAVAFWVAADDCTGMPQIQTSADGNHLTENYTVCAGGSEVKLVTLVNGGHQWPTLENQSKFSATDEIWDFFSRHSKK